MSVARTVNFQYEIETMERAARDLGFLTSRGTGARGWYGIMKGAENCDLVITSREHRFDIGLVRQPDNTVKLMADFHGGHVQKDMAEKLIPRYMEMKSNGRMKITNRVQDQRTVQLTLERR